MREKIEGLFQLLVVSSVAVLVGVLILSGVLLFVVNAAMAAPRANTEESEYIPTKEAAALPVPPPVAGVLTPDLTTRVRNHNGQLVRSASRRVRFLREVMHISDGKVPKGYIVDHIVPLFCGGGDIPSNMELLSEAEWRAKSRWERQPCSSWSDGTYIRLLQKALDEKKEQK
jgi:hypothetical protein